MPRCKTAAAAPAQTTSVWVSWRAGVGGFHVGARLVSLQCDGLSLMCSVPPPLGRDAEVLLDFSDGQEHASAATVAAVRAVQRGVYLVRLQFPKPCKLAFRNAALACLEGVE